MPGATGGSKEETAEPAALELLMDTTRGMHHEISQQLKLGRDHLLELNSCRDQEAEALKSEIMAQDRSPRLSHYMERLFEAYGVEHEEHSQHSLVIKPGLHMLTEYFPLLPPDGVTITYDRDTALIHEDRQFLTWEHPMVRDAMAMLLEAEQGNSTAMAVKHPQVTAGTLLLEMLFILECPAPRLLQAGRFLPPTLLRVLLDQGAQERTQEISQAALQAAQQPLDKNIARKIITPLRGRIQAMLDRGEELIAPRQEAITQDAIATMSAQYEGEMDRLESLQRVNPNIKADEVALLLRHKQALQEHMQATRVRLDAICLVIGV